MVTLKLTNAEIQILNNVIQGVSIQGPDGMRKFLVLADKITKAMTVSEVAEEIEKPKPKK